MHVGVRSKTPAGAHSPRLCASSATELVHAGKYFELCYYTLVDDQRPELGVQEQHKAPRTLMIRASQWLCYSGKAHDSLDDHEVAAVNYLKDKVSKYVEKGKKSTRKK